MRNRFELREQYIEGWYQLDAQKLISTTTEDFIFEDPAEPHPIKRAELPAYMKRWDARMRHAGGQNKWKLEHTVRQDENGIITDWEWWEVVDTPYCGMAFVKTSDQGVFLEKITYFDRLVYQ